MSFNSFMNKYNEAILIMEEIGLNNSISLTIKDNFVTFNYNTRGLSHNAARLIMDIDHQTSNLIECFLMSKICSEGPKLFQVDQIDFEMLIEMDVNIPMGEYVQPFPTVIIQLPENFSKNRSVNCPQVGTLVGDTIAPPKHEADYVIIHHNKDLGSIVYGCFFNSDMSIKSGFGCFNETIIEDILKTERNKDFNDSLEISEEERALADDLMRAAINFCLLVDEVGCKKVESAHEERLKRHLNVAYKSLNRQKIINAERELRMCPARYVLAQQTKFYTSETTGHSVSPHYRRGHYRMQRYGPGLTLSKRIRIAPCFVNASHLIGS